MHLIVPTSHHLASRLCRASCPVTLQATEPQTCPGLVAERGSRAGSMSPPVEGGGAQTGNSPRKLRQILSHGLCVFWFRIALFSVCPGVTWQPEKIVPFGLSKTLSGH